MSWLVEKVEHVGSGRFKIGFTDKPEVGVIVTSEVTMFFGWNGPIPHVGEFYDIHLEKAGDDEHSRVRTDG